MIAPFGFLGDKFNLNSLMDLINLQSNDVGKFTIIPTNKVSVWTEQNGSTTWTQGSDANRPLLDATTGVTFDATNDTLLRASDITATDYSLYVVVRYLAVNTGTSGNRALFAGLSTSDWLGFQNGYVLTLNAGGALKRTIKSGYKGNRFIVFAIRKSGNTLNFSINDRECVQSGTLTAVTSTLFGRINGIQGFTTFFSNMGIKAFCLSSSVFDNTTHKKIVDKLYNDYNLNSNTTADNIIGFGDSNTVGTGSTSYIQALANSLSLAYLNLGVSGTLFTNVTSQANNGYDRYQVQVVTKPFTDYISITYSGTNDILAGISASIYATQMSSMVSSLLAQGYNATRICICSPAYQRSNANSTNLDAYRNEIVTIKNTYGIKYFDLLQWMRDNGGDSLLVTADNIHLNQTGQNGWSTGIYNALTT